MIAQDSPRGTMGGPGTADWNWSREDWMDLYKKRMRSTKISIVIFSTLTIGTLIQSFCDPTLIQSFCDPRANKTVGLAISVCFILCVIWDITAYRRYKNLYSEQLVKGVMEQ